MKKRISILLMIVLVLAGCAPKEPAKTKEELRAEIKAELEAEAKLKEKLKEEVKEELKKEQQSDDTKNEKNTNESEKEDTKQNDEIIYTDDEMITTYAYLNNDSVDVSSLKKEEINLIDKIDPIVNYEYKEEMVWKIAFFGTVKNVEIYQSPFYMEEPTKLYEYDALTDTELSITAREMGDGDAIFLVRFKDERGASLEFTSWLAGREGKKVQLNSGFTKEEKTPTSYENFDISPYLDCIGMSEKEFLNSEIGQKCTKEVGFPESNYDYTIEIAKGIKLTYHPDKTKIGDYEDTEFRVKENADIMSITMAPRSNDEGAVIDYATVPEDERISIFGVDFSMTGVRAKKHFNNTLNEYNVILNTNISPEYDEFNSIQIKPKK